MKKLLGILVLGLLWCNISFADYCTDEDIRYSLRFEYIDNEKIPEDVYQNAKKILEDTYKFGLGIQKAVEDKDMEKLLSYVRGKLLGGQELSFFKNKSFDEIFTEEFRSKILSEKVNCLPLGDKGWMLGNGNIWYRNYDFLTIIRFNYASFAETRAARTAWKIGNKYIKPECLNSNQLHIWLSLDNYEEFFDKYISKIENHIENPEFQKFATNIGLYLNKEVPLDHKFRPSWSSDSDKDELSLTLDLSDCFNDKPITHVEIDGYDYTYTVLETYDLNLGKKLAPHIKKQFLSIKKVKASYFKSYHVSTYGILELNGKKKMVPLIHYDFR